MHQQGALLEEFGLRISAVEAHQTATLEQLERQLSALELSSRRQSERARASSPRSEHRHDELQARLSRLATQKADKRPSKQSRVHARPDLPRGGPRGAARRGDQLRQHRLRGALWHFAAVRPSADGAGRTQAPPRPPTSSAASHGSGQGPHRGLRDDTFATSAIALLRLLGAAP